MTEFITLRRSAIAVAGLGALLVIPMSGTAVAGGMAEPIVSMAMSDDLCDRTGLTRSEIRNLQNSADYADVLDYTLENCPQIAALLINQATATIAETSNADGGNTERTTSSSNGGETPDGEDPDGEDPDGEDPDGEEPRDECRGASCEHRQDEDNKKPY